MASSSSAADVSITREQLTKYFHLPITDVAKELGICATMLKKICRKNGIPRWPHRKIKSLNKMIESLEASLTNDGSEAGECIRQEIIILKNKKSLIMRNPSILVQGNSNKRSSEINEEGAQSSSKKQRSDALQAPVTTFTNPKQSLPSTSPNAFSINQLLTPPTTFSSPLTSAGIDEKDYRAYAHHAHAYPPHHMVSPFPDPSRADPKGHMEGRSFASPLTSYLPEDDGRHMESPLLHSADSYYFHKAALAYQYYPRQMLPPSYPPPPPHGLSARSPYYHPYGGHEGRPMHLLTQGDELAAAAELQEQHVHHQQQQQQQQAAQQQAVHAAQQAQQQAQQVQVQQQANQQQTTQAQQQQQQTQQVQQSTPSPQVPTQKQQPIQQRMQPSPQQQQTQQQQQQQQQQSNQTQPSPSEALPKMNISTSDIYKFRNQPPSPQSTSSSSAPSFSQGVELPYFYHQYSAQQQRLHPQ